jgi:hypothetical protein
MKRQLSVVALFLFVVSGLALGQGILPQPTLVDHQIVSKVGNGSFSATENIQTTYNHVVVSVTCNWPSNFSDVPCIGVGYPSDASGATWHLVERHYNTANNWTQEEWYAIISTTGSDVITFESAFTCSTCTWYAMVEQINGIQADN